MSASEMNLPKLVEQFSSEEKCHAYLEELRWPKGVECPRCQSKKISRITGRRQFECSDCRYQFSVRVDTVLQDSKLPLWKWFLAVYLMCESKKGMSANQLGRTIGVSYKTAWFLCQRIRAAMGSQVETPLSGIVEADETWHGGKQRGKGIGPYNSGKTMIVGAIERSGDVRLRVTGGRDRGTLHRFLKEVVDDDATAIFTDEWIGYHGIGDENTKHDTVRHATHEYVRGDVHTNTVENVWSLFKRSVIGSYHQVSVKHLPAYLDELEWRFNNRDNAFLFRDTILALVEADTLTFTDLTGKK